MHRSAAFAAPLALASASLALSIKYAQDLNVRLEATRSLDTPSQQLLQSALTRAKARCITSPNDLVISIEEVVAKVEPLAVVSPTTVVADFFRTLGVPDRQLFQGQVSLDEARHREQAKREPATLEPGTIAVQLVCTPKD